MTEESETPITDEALALPPGPERMEYKAQVYADIPEVEGMAWNPVPGYQIKVVEGPVVVGTGVQFVYEVRKGGVVVPINNPFIFVNPPILVEDPSGPVDRNGVRYREDPAEALRQISTAALKTALK